MTTIEILLQKNVDQAKKDVLQPTGVVTKSTSSLTKLI